MITSTLRAIASHLPERVETGTQLAAEFPDWDVAKIEQRTGIASRHIAAPAECVSDLAVAAALKLFAAAQVEAAQIDFLLLCTETPDYPLPPTACIVHHRLGLPSAAGALDYNLGSSGYVYGLALAQSMIDAGHASNVLLITADIYSRLIHPADKSTRVLFGDAAAATLVSSTQAASPRIGPFVFGTDGGGAQHLIVPAGGMREPRSAATDIAQTDSSGNTRTRANLFMDGAEVFSFTLARTPVLVRHLLEKASLKLEDIDLFVFHQPNLSMLETMRKQLKIPPERFMIHLTNTGNTVSATIPLALEQAILDGRLLAGHRVMLVGFGVGLSWAATIIHWEGQSLGV